MTQRLIDSLATDVVLGYDRASRIGVSCEEPIAVAILSSPELQQIKSTLLRMAAQIEQHNWFDSKRDVLVNYGLPDHVIEWVLG